MSKLLRTAALSAFALLFVACDAGLEDEGLRDLIAEAEAEAEAEVDDDTTTAALPFADRDQGDDPVDPTPFFDIERLATDDPGCATGGPHGLDLVDAPAAIDGEDLDLGLALDADLGDVVPDPAPADPELGLVDGDGDALGGHAFGGDALDLSDAPDEDDDDEDTSGYEPGTELILGG